MSVFESKDFWNDSHKVYAITNSVSGKIYVGKTSQKYLSSRLGKHKGEAKRGRDTYFYNAIRKYGSENFTISLLSLCENNDWASYHEKLWIKILDTRNKDKGYNTKEGGDGAFHTEETKEKLSRLQKDNPRPREFYVEIAKISNNPGTKEQRSARIKEAWAAGKYNNKNSSEKMKEAWASGRIDRKEMSYKLKEAWKIRKEKRSLASYIGSPNE